MFTTVGTAVKEKQSGGRVAASRVRTGGLQRVTTYCFYHKGHPAPMGETHARHQSHGDAGALRGLLTAPQTQLEDPRAVPGLQTSNWKNHPAALLVFHKPRQSPGETHPRSQAPVGSNRLFATFFKNKTVS